MTDAEFDAAVMAGPIVDMVGDGRMEYDGPRCAAEDCAAAVEEDGDWCGPCEDTPHEFTPCRNPWWPDWCVCGRIRGASVHPFDDVLSPHDSMTVDAGEYRRADRVFL